MVIIIVLLQVIYSFVDFSSEELIDVNQPEILAFQKQIDSLKAIEIEKRKPKVYPFNPNYITDYKGQKLGMTVEEIDRLLAFRKTNKFINSKNEFQKITKVLDSLLNEISPYFKYPDWVQKKNRNVNKESRSIEIHQKERIKIVITTSDINKATVLDFQTINGVDYKLSNRIVKYREKLQGFSIDNQLHEVWSIDEEIANEILSIFTIKELPIIKKINLNTATFKEVLANPYIDFKLCKEIFEYRDEVAEFQSLYELRNINNFPLNKYHRIALYLLVE